MTERELDELARAVPDTPSAPLSPFEIWRRLPGHRPSIVDVIETLYAWHKREGSTLQREFVKREFACVGVLVDVGSVAAYRFSVGTSS